MRRWRPPQGSQSFLTFTKVPRCRRLLRPSLSENCRVGLGYPIAAEAETVFARRPANDVVPALVRHPAHLLWIDRRDHAVALYHAAVDQDGVDQTRMRVVDELADRIVERRHAERVCPD